MTAQNYSYTPLHNMGPQGRWRRVLLIAMVPMLFAFAYYALTSSSLPSPVSMATPTPESQLPQAEKTQCEGPAPSAVPELKNASMPVVEEVVEEVKEPVDDLSMSAIIKALYNPVLHDIAASNFTDEDGDVYRLQGEPRFKEKLGKKVLILDIDSRPLTGDGQLMNDELKWKGMRPLSAGMLSHYMYGRYH